MTRKNISFIWIFFLLVIPLLYFLLKIVILPDTQSVEMVMLFAPYLFYIFTFMYRIDERFYFIIKRFVQWFIGSHTSWSFSVRYQKIFDCDKILKNILEELIKTGCKIIKKEQEFISIFWQSRNIFNFRIEKNSYDGNTLHFYTSIIDIPFRSMRKKIKEFSAIYENIENNIDMIDRSDKAYEIEISYSDSNPYYNFWVKTLHNEKIVKFNCIIHDDDRVINIEKSKIRYCTSSLNDLFLKIEKYINLRGD